MIKQVVHQLPLLIIIVFIWSGLIGCATTLFREKYGPFVEKDSAQIREQLKLRTLKLETISGLAKITIKGPHDTRNITEIILIDKNGNMRFESLNPFGQPSVFIVRNESQVIMYDSIKNRYIKGGNDLNVLSISTGINMSMDDIRRVIAQDFFSSPDYSMGPLTHNREKGESGFTISDTMGRKEVIIDNRYLPLSVYVYKKNGVIAYNVSYDSYRPVGEALFPTVMNVEFPRQNIRVTIKFEEIFLNEKIGKDKFIFRIPAEAIPIQF